MDIEQARFNMIEQQIRTWEVLDQDVLDLLNEIHREDFIPEDYKDVAFADTFIPIGHDQITMTPKLEARLLQSLDIESHESVLEIGTGCGYLTTLLACSAHSVTSIDIFPDLVESAQTKIAKTGLTNIELQTKDAYSLFDSTEKYDVIVLTASLPKMDDRFLDLLNDKGRLFVILGESAAMEACVFSKQDDAGYSHESLFETDIPALIGVEEENKFEF